MPIDPSIISGIRPVQIETPVNMLAQVLRVQGMQQEAQLGQAKLAEYERGRARQNAMQSLLQSLKPDTTDDQRVGALRGGGFFDEADRIEKGIGERRKVESEAGEREWKVKKDKLTFAGQAFGGVMKNPSLENALGTLDYLGQNGILPPELVEQYRGVVQGNPSQIGMLAEQAYRSVLAADKQLDAHQTSNLGGTTQTLGIDPVTGKATVLNTAVNTQSPDSVAADRRAAADRAAADRRAREQNPRGQVVQTDSGLMLVDPRTGTAQAVTAGGKPLQPNLKSLPAPIQKALLENDASLRKVDKALAAIEAYPDALGASNYLGDTIRQRTDPNGVEARALVADIGSLKIHDRSGAAVTAAETPRLKPFIPSATDDPETVKKKLGLFRQEYEAIQADINSTYTREQGYRPPAAARQEPAAATAQGYSDPEKERRYKEWKRSQGK